MCLLPFSSVPAQVAFGDSTLIRVFIQRLAGEHSEEVLMHMTEHGLIDSLDLRQLAPDASFVELFGTMQERIAGRQEGNPIGLSFTVDQYYLRHDTLLSGTSSPWTTQVGVTQEVKVMGLPFQLSGNGILYAGKLDPRRSGLSLSFDHQALISQQQKKFDTVLQDLVWWDKADEVLGLTASEKATLQNEIRFQLYQYLITHPSFSKTKEAIARKLESLSAETDSTAFQVVQAQQNKLTAIEALYRKTWQDKTTYKQEEVDALRQKTTLFLKEVRQQLDPNLVRQKLLKQKGLSFKDKLFLWTKRFEVGRFHLFGEGIAVKHLVLNGLHYELEQEKWFTGIAWGQQSFSTNFLPNFNRSFFDRFASNQALFLKAGLGQQQSNHFQFSVLQMKEGGARTDSSFLYPKRNIVFTLSGQQNLGKHWQLQGEFAFADHDLLATRLEELDGITNPLPMAGELSLAFRPKRTSFLVSFGAFYNGPRFISLGNPFILTNRQGVLLKIAGPLSKKLKLDLDVRYGHSIGEDELFEGDLSDLQVVGGLQWQIGKTGSISLRLAPNTFKQNGVGDLNVSNNNSLYHLQASFQTKVKEQYLQSALGYTNYRSQYSYYDTTALDQFNYVFIQESLTLSQNQALSMTINLGGSQPLSGQFEEFLGQVSYLFQIKKAQISLGGQLLQDRFDRTWRYGITTQLQWRISKQLSMGANLNYQIPINGPGREYILGHTHLRFNL